MAKQDEDFFNETSDDLEPETLEMEDEVEEEVRREVKKKKAARARMEEVTEEIKKITVGWAVAIAAITFLVGFISGGMIMKIQAPPAGTPDFSQLGGAPALTGDQATSGQLPSGHPTIPAEGESSSVDAGAGTVPGAEGADIPDLSGGEQPDTGDVPQP